MAQKTRQKSAARAENERLILEAAETVFAEYGYKGATTAMIAGRAGLPKANLHYYFPTKEALYRRVVEDIFNVWLAAADTFDDCDDPVEALTRYISIKMDISRQHPMGSKVWANEILHRAPVIQDYLETTLREWTASRVAIIRRWIDQGRIQPVNPDYLLYMIWATTQHYADFNHQIDTLNGGKPLSDAQFEEAKQTVISTILTGIGARRTHP
ncbi:TetR/AcrR family transcriptional regulator [Breoghania sp. L-A4]|uniref:TetR/AcrR family transcriptional regulator n=1 Tax=Breoghania sp. L-A4 TaxID=2304600 RepID=UPI000E35988D|nr:TetR/AcrR family transcriptional regulator [Breoghania sp. L-A4]AXS41733.1 TetR/AcrR family transcriptional regulator [Breoghania sp. L-A4]